MKHILEILETTENNFAAFDTCIKEQIKITNTSNAYINDLKLIINSKEIPILNQCIIRQRGCLSFDAVTNQLELGNLAPDETAYFEYIFKPIKNTCSLLSEIAVHYTPEYSDHEVCESVIDLLAESSSTHL